MEVDFNIKDPTYKILDRYSGIIFNKIKKIPLICNN